MKRRLLTALALATVTALALVASSGARLDGGAKKAPPKKNPKAIAAAKLKAQTAAALRKLVTAAKAEGELTWYSADTEDINQLFIDGFARKYGIKVSVLRLNETQLIERLTGEWRAGVKNADALTMSNTVFVDDNPTQFMPVTKAAFPGVVYYPAQGRAPRLVYIHSNPSVIQYNTNLVPKDKVPKKWTDMADPFWKGKIILTDPRASQPLMGWAELMLRQHGDSFLVKLRGQSFTLTQSGSTGAQAVAAGATYANFPARTVHSAPLRAQGAPIGYVILPGSASTTFLSVLSSAAHPNAAKLFAIYQMSVEAQKAMCVLNRGDITTFYAKTTVPQCHFNNGPKWRLPDYNVAQNVQNTIISDLGLR